MTKIPYNAIAEEIVNVTGLHYDGNFVGLGLQFTDIEQTGSTLIANTVEEVTKNLAIMRFKFLIGDIERETKRLKGMSNA